MTAVFYVWGILLYGTSYGADVVLAMLNRRALHVAGAVAIPMPEFRLTIDRALLPVRFVTLLDLGAFSVLHGVSSRGGLLAIGAICCEASRWVLFPKVQQSDADDKGIPILSVRAIISAMGLFFLVVAGLVK